MSELVRVEEPVGANWPACEHCGEVDIGHRDCWAGYCTEVFCWGCKRSQVSYGPVGCPGCTYGRRDPKVSAMHRAYTLRRGKRRFKR